MAQMKFIMLFMICTSLVLFVANSQAQLYEQNNEFLDFFVQTQVYDDPDLRTIELSESFNESVVSLGDEQSNGFIDDLTSFIDTIKVVWSFVVNILLGLPIINLLISLNLPMFITYLIAIPLYVAYVVGIVEFIRGFSA